MIRHIPMLLVATLFVGGCHRNKPASKAPRSTAPMRSSNPKEVKPAVISITPVPISKPVVVPAVKKEQSVVKQTQAESGSRSPAKPVVSSGASVKRPEQTKVHQSPAVSAPASKATRSKETEVPRAAKESPKPTVEATTDVRMPWERPLYEPAASKGQKVKSEEDSKARSQTAKQISEEPARTAASEPMNAVPPATDTSSSSDLAVKQEAPANIASPVGSTEQGIKGRETALGMPTNQPKDAVSGSTLDVSAESPKFASRKSSRAQATQTPVGSPKEMESKKSEETSGKKAEEQSVVVGAAALQKPLEATAAPEAPAPAASHPSGAAPSLAGVEPDSIPGPVLAIKPSVEVAKESVESQKVTIVAPKKLSDAERKEAVRKQANDSYQSGQQLIRESRNAEAMQALKQTVKLAPESADAWLRIAYILEREGKLDEARRAFKEAKKFWSF